MKYKKLLLINICCKDSMVKDNQTNGKIEADGEVFVPPQNICSMEESYPGQLHI